MNIFNKEDYRVLNSKISSEAKRIDSYKNILDHTQEKFHRLDEKFCNLMLYLFKDIYDYQKYKGKHFIFNSKFFEDNMFEIILVNELLQRTFGFGEICGNCINDVVTLMIDENTLITKENGYCLSELIEDMEKYQKEKKEK